MSIEFCKNSPVKTCLVCPSWTSSLLLGPPVRGGRAERDRVLVYSNVSVKRLVQVKELNCKTISVNVERSVTPQVVMTECYLSSEPGGSPLGTGVRNGSIRGSIRDTFESHRRRGLPYTLVL